MAETRMTAELEYRLDFPCLVPLRGLPLVARGRYVEVTPMTVALRLMEDSRFGLKEVGLVLQEKQVIDPQDILEFSYGGKTHRQPGRQPTASMTILAEMSTLVEVDDWQEIRPDVPLSDFKGILVGMNSELHW